MWASDGTAEGTALLGDLTRGTTVRASMITWHAHSTRTRMERTRTDIDGRSYPASVRGACAATGIRAAGERFHVASFGDAQAELRAAMAAVRAHLRSVGVKSEQERADEARGRVLAEREAAEAELRGLRHGLQASSVASFEGRLRGLTLDHSQGFGQ